MDCEDTFICFDATRTFYDGCTINSGYLALVYEVSVSKRSEEKWRMIKQGVPLAHAGHANYIIANKDKSTQRQGRAYRETVFWSMNRN